jgi:multiple sugar transport system substrate-binding protein
MRRAATLILFLLIALITAGCGLPAPGGAQPTAAAPTPPGAGSERTRIGFGGLEFERAAYEPIIAAFNAANPDLEVVFVPIEGLLMGGGASSDLLRQLAEAADTFPSLLAGPGEDVNSPYVADLRPLMEADPTFAQGDFLPGALQPAADGGLYILPTTLSVQTLAYNRDLWEAAGLAAPPAGWSWDDLLAAAEQLTRRDGDELLVHGLDDGQDGLLVLAGLLAEAGVPAAPAADGTIDLDRPEVLAALERVAELIERGVIYRRSAEDSAPPIGPGSLVDEGRVGMWIGGSDVIVAGPSGPIQPQVAVEEAALPPLPRNGVMGSRGYMLSAGSARPEAAWRWLSHLSRQSITRAAGVRIGGGGHELPARASLVEAEGFWESVPPSRAAALQATLAVADRLPEPADRLVGERMREALGAVVAGTRAEQALAGALAELDAQLAERSAAPTPTPDPIAVQLPEPTVIPQGATTISFGALGPSLPELRRLAEQFNAGGSGVYVQVEPPAIGGRGQLSLASMAERYDCFIWPQAPTAEERELLLDLQPLLDAEAGALRDDYPAALLAPLRAGGGLYGLPRALNLRALNYNRDLFRAAGLAEPAPEWQLADLLEAARRLTAEAGDERYGYAVDGPMTDDLLAFLGWQGAPAVTLAGGEPAPRFIDEAVAQAIAQYITLLGDYSPHGELSGYRDEGGFMGVGGLAEEGRVGMWYSGGIGRMVIRIGGPEEQAQRPDVAIAPPPLGQGGLTGADFSSDAMAIAARSASPEACWAWLTFLSEQTGGLGESFPARSSLATSEAYLSQARPGAAELYAAYAAALADPDSAVDPYAGVDLFWLFQAVDRAMQGADLERELADAQLLTEQYLACVAGGEAPESCATAADPDYAGFGPR